MSETFLFIVGVIVFAITVYGAVMAGGLELTRRELAQDEELMKHVEDADARPRVPVNLKY